MDKAHLYYATDTYCIWCWGFGPALREFARRHADDAFVDVVIGGLLVGDRVVPVGQKTRVRESAQRVCELCGVTMGEGFERAVEEGSTVLDSLVAARAFVSLREQLPAERQLDIAHRLQEAWYRDGEDLHDENVLSRIAEDLGADVGSFLSLYHSQLSTTLAEAEFQRRKDLDIKGYPTLLLETDEGLKQVGGPTSSADRLEQCYEALRAGRTPEEDPDDDRE